MDDKEPDNVIDLFWHGLKRVGRNDPHLDALPSYLFKTSTAEEYYVEVMMDMAKLNNYVLRMGESLGWDDTEEKPLDEALEEAGLDELDRGGLYYFLGSSPLDMDTFVRTSSAANALVVIYFWFIKNLKDICRWVEPELYAEKVKAKEFHRYELGTILDILDANTECAVTKDLYRGRIKIVMDAVQRLRNDYAHGNWDDLTTHIKQLRLVKVLESISVFLSELEMITNERGGYTL